MLFCKSGSGPGVGLTHFYLTFALTAPFLDQLQDNGNDMHILFEVPSSQMGAPMNSRLLATSRLYFEEKGA